MWSAFRILLNVQRLAQVLDPVPEKSVPSVQLPIAHVDVTPMFVRVRHVPQALDLPLVQRRLLGLAAVGSAKVVRKKIVQILSI